VGASGWKHREEAGVSGWTRVAGVAHATATRGVRAQIRRMRVAGCVMHTKEAGMSAWVRSESSKRGVEKE
jgi:hypothetical protein